MCGSACLCPNSCAALVNCD